MHPSCRAVSDGCADGRAEFGRSSEKLAREIDQLELALEALEVRRASQLRT
jgi:Transposase C of IS166 homeodomain